MIVTIGGEKGGTGKSMITVNMAARLVHAGKTVAILDCDPKPASSTWAHRRQSVYNSVLSNELDTKDPIFKKMINRKLMPKAVPFERVRGDIIRTVESMARDYDYVLIDAGGFDGKEQRTAFILSDIILFPVRPEQFDLDSVPNLRRMFNEANITARGRLKAYFVLNQCPTNRQLYSDITDAKDYLHAVKDIEVARSNIYTRTSYSKATRKGLAGLEIDSGMPLGEISALCKEVLNV